MAVVNRTLDISEQRKNFTWSASNGGASGALGTGCTSIVCIVPWPSTLVEGQIAAIGLSGAPSYELAVNRFIAGSGITTWIVAKGTSNTPAAYGTSGAGAFGTSLFGSSGIVLVASGSTLLNLQANDVISVTTGVANAAANAVSIGLVLAPIQDIKVSFGLV